MPKTVFAAIVGRPNVGKSTLINALVGQKVAIVSKKPQTTRNRIMGICVRDDIQYVFTDTPGMHLPKTKLGEYMVKSVNAAVDSVDAALLVVEPDEKPHPAEEELMDRLAAKNTPVILVINKTDTVQGEKVAKSIAAYSEAYDLAAVVPASALKGGNIAPIFDELAKFAFESEWHFDADDYTDQPERAIAAEIIREKLLRRLEQEIPHGIAVEINEFDEAQRDGEGSFIKIDVTIHCEKKSHKGIIIGKGGEMLARIRKSARADMEKLFGCRVLLTFWVKVNEKWRDSNFKLKDFGFNPKNL